jgi:hypothetical protein
MDLKSLIGRKFQEGALFEFLQFEIEENLSDYLRIFFHIYFDKASGGEIVVREIVYFEDKDEFVRVNKLHIRKRYFMRAYGVCSHVNLNLHREDNSGRYAIIWKDRVETGDGGTEYLEDNPNSPKLTPNQIRDAFRELAGLFEARDSNDKLKSKKAV